MQKSYVWSSIGKLVMILGGSMFIPAAAGLYYGEAEYRVFLQVAVVTLLAGLVLYLARRPVNHRRRVSLREGYAVVAYGWIVAALIAMLPYLLTGTLSSVTDGFFEAMSGLTTTGASVMSDIESAARCVLLWRSLTHWLGGMGILVLFVALLAGQGTGAMQIFRAEASGPVKSKLQPKITETARVLWLIYVLNTLVIISLYDLAGMSFFDAVNHGFSVIATGGFSTKNLSIGYYNNVWIDWVTVLAMFVAGINYSLYFYAFRTRSLRCFWESLELRVYLAVTVIASGAVTWFLLPAYGYDFLQACRYGAFQVVSILTTTGFMTADYELWATPAQVILMLLMLCGACAGSTTGGIKIDRHVILAQKAVQEVRRFLHPRLVTRLKSNGKPLDDEVVLSVTMFFYIYMCLLAASTYLLCVLGADLLDGLTAAMSCLGGIGPAIGVWGPVESYASAPALSKWLLSLLMLVGRLEIYTVLVLIRPPHKNRRQQEQAHEMEKLEENAMFEPLVREE